MHRDAPGWTCLSGGQLQRPPGHGKGGGYRRASRQAHEATADNGAQPLPPVNPKPRAFSRSFACVLPTRHSLKQAQGTAYHQAIVALLLYGPADRRVSASFQGCIESNFSNSRLELLSSCSDCHSLHHINLSSPN